jgi:hypothetical protein
MPSLSTQGQNTGYTHYLKFTYEDLQRQSWADTFTSASDVRKKIAIAKRGSVVTYVTAFSTVSAAGASDITLTCGPTSISSQYLLTSDIDVDTVYCNTGSLLATTNRDVRSSDAPIWIRVQGTIANLTAGEWIVAVKILDAGDITN